MPDLQVDYITGDEFGNITGGDGSVAQTLLANNMNPQALRTAASLRKDEWEVLDTSVVQIARERLNGVADLRNNNHRMRRTSNKRLQHEK